MQNVNIIEGEESDNDVMVVDDSNNTTQQPRPREHIIPIYLEATGESTNDTQLKELGLFEEGMTEKQKQELLQVVAASRQSAPTSWGGEGAANPQQRPPATLPIQNSPSHPNPEATPFSLRDLRAADRKKEEEDIDSQLEELGLLEEGMTKYQKLEILQVIKASKETALREEKMRIHLTPTHHPPSYDEACGSSARSRPSLFHSVEPEEDAALSEEEPGGSSGQQGSGQNSSEEFDQSFLEKPRWVGPEEGQQESCSSAEEVQEEGEPAHTVHSWWTKPPSSPALPSKRTSSMGSLREEVPYFCPEEGEAENYTQKLLDCLDRYHRCLRDAQETVPTTSLWGGSTDGLGTFDLAPRRNKTRRQNEECQARLPRMPAV